ncbi:MAG: HD domain-containing protein, partial [Longimicrobiales bacterium]
MTEPAAVAAQLERWAAGDLPEWAVVTPKRYAHMRRVATLMNRWAAERGLDDADRRRWRLAGWLHDALRDAPHARIRAWIDEPKLRALPGSFLHGPAAAAR